jgi:hypothetical protein
LPAHLSATAASPYTGGPASWSGPTRVSSGSGSRRRRRPRKSRSLRPKTPRDASGPCVPGSPKPGLLPAPCCARASLNLPSRGDPTASSPSRRPHPRRPCGPRPERARPVAVCARSRVSTRSPSRHLASSTRTSPFVPSDGSLSWGSFPFSACAKGQLLARGLPTAHGTVGARVVSHDLGAFLRPRASGHFQAGSAPGVSPFRVFIPARSRPPSRESCPSCRFSQNREVECPRPPST